MATKVGGAAKGTAKSAARGGAKKAAPPAAERTGQFSIISLKGTEEYRDWLTGVSKKTHIAQASIVRLALAEWAERNGHESPPEK